MGKLCFWRISICILFFAVLFSTIYVVIGLPFLPLLLQTWMHVSMMSRKTPSPGLQSLESGTLIQTFGALPKQDYPTTGEGFRDMMVGFVGMFWERTAIGAMQSCPRTHRNVATEVWFPVEGHPNPNGLRLLQIDWDAEKYEQEKDTASGVILFFHGGGYVCGAPEFSVEFAARLSRRTASRVYSLDYRLAPENQKSAAIDDAFAAYKHIVEVLGVPPERIAFGGDSAGGGLVISTIQRVVKEGMTVPAAAFAISPWVDISGEASAKSYEENEGIDVATPIGLLMNFKNLVLSTSEIKDAKDPILSPLYGSFVDFPPLFVTVSKTESIRDECLELVRRINAAGAGPAEVYMPDVNLPHDWTISCLPEGVEDTAVLSYWIVSRWKDAATA